MKEKARQFAINYHKDQTYGSEPYVKHLDHVYEVSKRFNLSEEIQIASYLHDLLEDTDCNRQKLWDEFGWYIEHIVFLVTDEPGSNRKERKLKTYQKIKYNPDAILLKLCDRIANMESSIQNNEKLKKMYIDEYPMFKSELYTDSNSDIRRMFEYLEKLNNIKILKF